jgi:pimeloyl-ACP methyl ester carboxylesterase
MWAKKMMIVFLFVSWNIFSQDIAGDWYGDLNIDGVSLQVIFTINKNGKNYSAAISVPMQGAERIPMSSASFENNTLVLSMQNPPISFEGRMEGNIIKGQFKQGGRALPLQLTQDKTVRREIRKPQEPVAPYPYFEEEVKFYNKYAKINLSGTLTLPKKEGKFPVVILVSGSGPQNRNQEIMGHKPFWVLADYLTKKGIGVLRYDDRGIGASQGNFNAATSVDFSYDAEAALDYLKSRKEIDDKKIGLMGHSEGGLIVPMVAIRRSDVRGVVLLAAPAVRGDMLLLAQQEKLGRANGTPEEALKKTMAINREIFDLVIQHQDSSELKLKLANYLSEVYDKLRVEERPQGISKNDFIKIQAFQIASPWMKFYLKYDPAIALSKLRCPVLAANGELDLQVPAAQNLDEITRLLQIGGNSQTQILRYPGLNHLFQTCNTGSTEEYGMIEETFSPKAMEDISAWWLKVMQ